MQRRVLIAYVTMLILGLVLRARALYATTCPPGCPVGQINCAAAGLPCAPSPCPPQSCVTVTLCCQITRIWHNYPCGGCCGQGYCAGAWSYTIYWEGTTCGGGSCNSNAHFTCAC